MNWLDQLLFDSDSIAHIVLLYTVVISVGIYLGKIKFFGISLGVTFVLFAGILAGHFGFTGTTSTLNFLQDFGLILFVYCIGLQVGPGFFESFKKGGIIMNLLACGIVALNIVVMLALYFAFFDTSDPQNLPMMVGVLCGAVTNTPGLGAATEALTQVFAEGTIPQIASGYACAYPLGVVGIIAATISIRYLCGIVLKDEEDKIIAEQAENPHAKPHKMTLRVSNTALDGKTMLQVRDFLGRDYVCSRSLHEGHVSIPNRDTKLYVGDNLFIVCAEDDAEAIKAFIGPEESMQIQCRIGADIHMAYDELTSLADSYEYNVESLARTERWAKRSLKEHKKHCYDLGYYQALYGVLQGGRWEDLRRSTAKKLAKMDFDGFGLGGAFLKENLGDILRWCCEELPEMKPRHLLGLSHPDDILIGIENGADTFDCVAPSREARHGRIYTRHGNISIKKFTDSEEPLDIGCDCMTCRAGWTKKRLRQLLKSENKEDKYLYFNLATIHNLRFIIRLTEEIQQAILEERFEEYKANFLRQFYGI